MAALEARITKLPEEPKPALQRWQQLPTRQKPMKENSPCRMKTPKIIGSVHCKTPKPTGQPSKPKTPGHGKPKTPGHVKPKTPSHMKPKTPVHSVIVSKTSKTPKSAGKPKTPSGCRFLPTRGGNEEYSSYLLLKGENPVIDDGDSQEEDEDDEQEETGSVGNSEKVVPVEEEYHSTLMSVACYGDVPRGVLAYKNTTPANSHQQGSFLNYTANNSIGSASVSRSLMRESHKKKDRRKVSLEPEKILDAPSLMNDYYLNTIDWGCNNLLGVALGSCVYMWNATEGTVNQLVQLPEERDLYVSSVSWADTGKYLAVGVSNGDIQLWDVAKEKKVRTMRGHSDRVSSLHWNSYTLASGCRSGEVYIHDVRKPQHCTAQLKHHSSEVCGLQWSPDGRQLASGGNDNLVCLWTPSTDHNVSKVLSDHKAAVKALAWCPWQQNLLATGGGSNDKTIRFWNTATGECQRSLNTKSQVSAVKWNKDSRELLSSHGNPNNQLIVWNYPSLTKVAELKGHSERVLNVSMSPRRTRVISAGADETLRVWKCFDVQKPAASQSVNEGDSISSALLGGMF